MKKVLLSLAVLGAATAANAQLLNYGFEDDQTAVIDTANWAVYPESSYNLKGGDAFGGAYALNVNTDVTANRWERVIAFKGLAIEPEKSYRVRMKVQSASSMHVALMQGDWYRDIDLKAGNGETAAEQIDNVTFGGTGAYETYSHCFWSPSVETMQSFYKNETYPELLNAYFLRLSFTGAGSFLVDDIVVEESAVKGVRFNGDAIAVDFGYATNAAELAKAAGGTAILSSDCVSVLVDGEPAAVESVELKSDGTFGIFLTEDYWLTDENAVSVSFTNTVGLTYSTHVAPECFTNPNAPVYAFENEAGEYDEGFELTSVAYEEAELVTSAPLNESFGLDEDITTFTFTYNKPVLCEYDGDKAVAHLYGQSDDKTVSVDEELILVENEEAAATLTFNRAAGAPALAKGQYSVSVSNVYNEKGVAKGEEDVVTFETGKVQVAKNITTELFTTLLEGANNGQPTGWSIMVNTEANPAADWTGGEPKADNGNACRNLNVTGSDGVEYTAFYLCDRDGYTYMKYGDQEGANITLPAGEIEFSVIGLSHDDPGHTLAFRLEDLDGNELVNTTGSCSVVANNQFTSIISSDYITANFNNAVARNVILKVRAPQGGFTACRVLGFRARSIVKTEGDSFTAENVAVGNFSGTKSDYMPDHGTGWKIYRDADRMRDPGYSGAWGGDPQDWTGGGGSRVKTLGNKGLGGAGIYLAGGACATYGEFDLQTDHNGTIEGDLPEQTFEVARGRYQVTYYIIGWKELDKSVKFEIIPFDQGRNGTAVYSRQDEVDAQCGSGSNSSEAKKVQFFWNASAGKYLIKVSPIGSGEGEAVFGNMTIETTASLALQYAQMMDQNLQPAKAELELAMAKEEYRGTTRDALAQIIADNEEPRFHTVADYDAEFARIEALIKKSQKRRSNIDAYPTSLQGIKDGLDAALGTKYEGLEQFPTVQQAYNDYKDVDYIALDDDALAAAVEVMGNNGTLLANLVKTCVPLLTKQVEELAAAVVALNSDLAENEVVVAAGNALSDDQELAKALKAYYTASLYGLIAAGHSPFEVEDPEYGTTYETLEANFLLQNRNFYCVQEISGNDVSVAADAFPGWTLNVTSGAATCAYNTTTWGGAYPTATKPVEDCAARSGWGTTEFTVEQLISNIPYVKYGATLTIGEDGSAHSSYAYCGKDTARYEAESYSRDETAARTFTGVAPVIDEENGFASLTLGAFMHVEGGFINVDKATLTMEGAVEGFDYAAAAAKVNQYIADGIELVEREDAPVAVTYFNLNGQKSVASQGVNIKVERYADGYTVVKKVIIK